MPRLPTDCNFRARVPQLKRTVVRDSDITEFYPAELAAKSEVGAEGGAVWAAPIIGLKTLAAILFFHILNCLAFGKAQKFLSDQWEGWPGIIGMRSLPYCQPWLMQWSRNPPISSLGMLTLRRNLHSQVKFLNPLSSTLWMLHSPVYCPCKFQKMACHRKRMSLHNRIRLSTPYSVIPLMHCPQANTLSTFYKLMHVTEFCPKKQGSWSGMASL